MVVFLPSRSIVTIFFIFLYVCFYFSLDNKFIGNMYLNLPEEVRIKIFSFIPITQTKEILESNLENKDVLFKLICDEVTQYQQNVFVICYFHSALVVKTN